MARMKTPHPTEMELAILRVLWERGPSTVRDIYEIVRKNRDSGYTSILKLLQIMIDKGLVTRDDTSRSHIYRPLVSEAQVQQQIVTRMLNDAFGGSAKKLVMQALSVKKSSQDEIAEIRRWLDEWEGGGK